MSTNFDDLLPIPNTPSTPMASVESTPQSVRSTSTPNTTSTVASSSSYSTVSPPRTLTYALDDPSNNPFADLPSTSKNFHDDSNHSSFPFSKITKEKETVNSLKGSLLQSSLDPLSSNFENLSLSSPKLESISPASTPQPSQLSNLIMTASSTTPFTSPQGSNLTSIGRSHTTLASPIDNSEIFFPSKKPPPSFLAQESSTLQDAEDAWTSYDPLLNPPASSSSTDPQPTPARIHALHVPSDLLVSANASTFSESPLFSPRPLPPASSNVSVPTSFFVSVTDPIKVSDPLNPYVIYKVTSKKMTDHPPLEYVVSRRYTEFLWVYQELLSKYPGLVIPCLPEKQAIGRFHDTFIEHRRLGLTRFLIQLANHPILAQDPQFIMFLQSETITHKGHEKNLSTLSKIKVHDNNKYFAEKLRETETLEELMKGLLKSLETLMVKHQELSKSHAEFSDLLLMFAEVEEPQPLFQDLQKWAEVHQRIKLHHLDITSQNLMKYMMEIENHLRTFHSVKVALHIRNSKLSALHTIENTMQQKRASLSKTNVSQPNVVSELDKITASFQAANQSFQETTQSLYHEFERIDKEHYLELAGSIQTLFDTFSEKQLKLVYLWESFYKQLPKSQ